MQKVQDGKVEESPKHLDNEEFLKILRNAEEETVQIAVKKE